MALSKEIENYYKLEGLSEDGILRRIRAEKKDFLEDAQKAAIITYTWALDKRQEDIETVKIGGLPGKHVYRKVLNKFYI